MTDKQIIKLLEEKEQINKFIQSEQEKFKEIIKDSEKRRTEISDICWQFFIENKKYCPMDKLKEFKGEDIYEITLIFADGDTKYFSYGDIIKIDDNGRFYFSDYENGIIEFNERKQKYCGSYLYTESEMDIIGFYDLTLGSLFKQEEVKESKYEELLKC